MSTKSTDSSPKNYFGSLAGLIGAGPMDELCSVIIDGKTVWPTDKGWADDIVDIAPVQYKRKGNKAYVYFSQPVRVGKGKSFIITGMDDASFDEASPITTSDAGAMAIKYPNTGADVALTTTTNGALTKIVTYVANDIVRYNSLAYKCILGHVGTPDKAPPNATYWVAYTIKRADVSNPYQFTIQDSMTNYGVAYLYWGTDDQTLRFNTFLANQPPYRRCCFVELENFLFGEERQAAPNIQFVMRRLADQLVVTGASADLVDGQCNPIAAKAEMLTHPVWGIGQTTFTNASWQDLADDLATDDALTYISPIAEEKTLFREFIATILAYYDGWDRFDEDGTITVGRFAHNEAPPSFDASTTIDFNDCIEPITYDPESWADTFSQTTCKGKDRARAYKDAGRSWKSGANQESVGDARPQTLARPWITRESQMLLYASEYGKICAQRKISGQLTVRREKCAAISVGDLFKLTHDAADFSIICRCTGKTFSTPPSLSVMLRFESERGFAPLPFQPTIPNPSQFSLAEPETITLEQIIQPPPALVNSNDFFLVVLAARKHSLTRGFATWFLLDDVNSDFYSLGTQLGWHVKGELHQDYADNLPDPATTSPPDDTTETLQLDLDSLQNPDDVSSILSPQSADAVNNNNLLIWLISDADPTVFEICTVINMELNSGVYKLKVRRARFGTIQLALVTGDHAYIGFRSNLVFYNHEKFIDYAGSGQAVTLRLQSFTAQETADLTDSDLCPDLSFTFSDQWAPTAAWTILQQSGVDISDFTITYDTSTVFAFTFFLASQNGNLDSASLQAIRGSEAITIWSSNLSGPIATITAKFSLNQIGSYRFLLTVKDSVGHQGFTNLYAIGSPATEVFVNIQATLPTQTTSPIVSPSPGLKTTMFVTVSMLCPTSGSTCFYQELYSTDAAPTAGGGGWSTYATPFSMSVPLIYTISPGHVSAQRVLYAYASKAGLTDSDVVSSNYYRNH